SIAFGDRLIMKLFRRLDAGINPDLEVGRFLTEKTGFLSTPPFAGSIELQTRPGEPRAVAILQGFVANQGDAWEFTRRELERYFGRAATRDPSSLQMSASLFELLDVENPDEGVAHAIGAYLDAARLMGQRVAGLHLALMSDINDPDFAPEPYTTLYQR